MYLLEVKSEVTLEDLVNGVKKDAEAGRKNRFDSLKALTITNIKVTPFVGSRTILISAKVKTSKFFKEAESAPEHNAVIFIMGQSFSNKPTPPFKVQVDDNLWIPPLFPETTYVMVNCTCEDFYFAWSDILLKKNALYGGRVTSYDPKEYRRQKIKRELEQEYGKEFKGRLPKEVEQELNRRLEQSLQNVRQNVRQSRGRPYPGFCKHLLKVYKYLEKNGWFS